MVLVALLDRHSALTLTELVRHSGLPKPTVVRLLAALEEHGLVHRSPERMYRLGFRWLHFGTRVADSLDVRRLAAPCMRHLRDQTGQSVQLVVIDGDEGVYVERVEGTTPVRLYIAVGRRAPLYAGASTRLLLAYCPPDRQAEILAAHPPVAHTATTITDLALLHQSLAEIRAQGWSLSIGELQPASAEMAAPIFDAQGRVIAALSLAGPDQLYGPAEVSGYLPLLQAAAARISRDLGYETTQGGEPT